ncbi:MAG: class I SAM-dependent methyltransferase [Candidatus Limnocylindrales bacterium]
MARVDRVIVDLGTGDGRAVLRRAAAEPSALVIGIDAVASAMREASQRAARRGPANALFVAEGVERLPAGPLTSSADLVTVTLPWGSLLRGVLGRDQAALAGVASVVAPGGRVEVLASVVPSDGVDGVDRLTASAAPAIRGAWAAVGLELTGMRPAAPHEVAAAGSTWARRLGDRPVWRLEGRRSVRATQDGRPPERDTDTATRSRPTERSRVG